MKKIEQNLDIAHISHKREIRKREEEYALRKLIGRIESIGIPDYTALQKYAQELNWSIGKVQKVYVRLAEKYFLRTRTRKI